MPEKFQESVNYFNQIVTWAWVFGLSAWGGAVSYFHKVTRYGIKFSVLKFLAEIMTSAFVGVLTFLLCDSANLSWGMTAAFVGISGHMGTRALFMIEKKYESFIGDKKDK